ncbi:MAG: hypothetical protein R6U96_08970 [Promethearchaeia archaeon]
MKSLFKLPQISKLANEIYFAILGKPPRTISELREILNGECTKEEIKEILKELIEKKLLIKIPYQNHTLPTHYQALPPFGPINEYLLEIKALLTEKESLNQTIGEKLENVFEKNQTLSLDTLYKDFKKLKDDIDEDTETIRKETKELVSSLEDQESITAFLNDYEETLKETVSSEMASVVIEIIKLKNKFPDELEKLNISDAQWDGIKGRIKDIMTLETHKKAQEIQDIISSEFEGIRETLNSKLSFRLEQKFEQNSVYLGIMNIFTGEMKKLHKLLLSKKNNLEKRLDQLADSVQDKTIQILNENFSHVNEKIKETVGLLKDLIKVYSDARIGNLQDLLPMNSIRKFKDVLLESLKDPHSDALILIPEIEKFMPLEILGLESREDLKSKLKKMEVTEHSQPKKKNKTEKKVKPISSQKQKIRIISSEPHSDRLIRLLKGLDKYEYKRLENNELIGLLKEESLLLFGNYNKQAERQSNEVLGFITSNKDYLTQFRQLFEEKWKEATYEKNREITSRFNKVLENINTYSGYEIGNLFENALNFTFQKEGVSLNVLELKLLGKKLKKIHETLGKEDKKEVINKIQEYNKKISDYELAEPPQLKQVPSEEEKEKGKKSQIEIFQKKQREINKEKIEELFNLFIDKMDKLTGEQISNQISQFIELILRFQGFSEIIEWKSKLSEKSTPLDEDFKDALIKDFLQWKNDIISSSSKRKSRKASPQKKILPSGTEASTQQTVGEYGSPKLAETPSNGETEDKTDLNALANDLLTGVNNYTGAQVSKKLQNIMDIIMEKQSFASVPKVLKFWKGKLRMNRKRLPESLKDDFLEEFQKWYDDFQLDSEEGSEKEKKKIQGKEEKTSTQPEPQQKKVRSKVQKPGQNKPKKPSSEVSEEDKEKLDKFDKILAELDELKGFEISKKLQLIMDDILESEGYSMALKDMRQWISKLRMIREPLKPEKKEEFLETFNKWRDNYSPDTEEDKFEGYKPGFLK